MPPVLVGNRGLPPTSHPIANSVGRLRLSRPARPSARSLAIFLTPKGPLNTFL